MTTPSYQDLLTAYGQADGRDGTGVQEYISGIEGKLAYNPCLIVEPGRSLLALRVESPGSYWRDRSSWDPQVRFFTRIAGQWVPAPETPVFYSAEDPFATWMRDADGRRRLVFGVVSLDYSSTPPVPVTRFFAAPDVRSLDPDAPVLSVTGMKDVRLLQRARDVVVCGRPQGGRAGIGRISVAVAESFDAVTRELIEGAHIFTDQVAPDTKLGVNELYDLGDTVGVLGHVAVGQEGSTQRYAAAWWTIDPLKPAATTPVVLATRADFPPGPAKFPAVADVVFPGSFERLPDGRTRMFCGLGDASVGSAILSGVPLGA